MTEYIDREAALALVRPDDPNDERYAVTVETAKRLIRHVLTAAPAADVAPVVRCKDCKYSYEDISGLTCAYGPPVGCIVQDNFYCANGEREEE